MDVCTEKYPPVVRIDTDHEVACWAVAEARSTPEKAEAR
jgi:hypothetical protein